MRRAATATILALLFAAAPVFTSGAPAEEEGDIPSISNVPDTAAAEPPYCTPIEHMGERGYIVDQAWMAYRRVERSSPPRVGWCACARRCEPIDKLAARYEQAAFQAYRLYRDPSIPGNQRTLYGKQATRLFAQRNRTVTDFRSCVDKARPPLSPPTSLVDVMADPLPAGCKIDIDLTIRQEWARWCADYMTKFNSVSADFITEFKPKKFAGDDLRHALGPARRAADQQRPDHADPEGQQVCSLDDPGRRPRNTATRCSASTCTTSRLDASQRYYDFKGKLTTFTKVNEPIKCPEI